MTFSSAGSADPDGSIVSYAWQFGDGTSAAAKIINVTQAPPPPPPPPPPTGAGCVVKYVKVNDWVSGFLGEVTITNKGTQTYTSWDVRFSFPGNQTITSFRNSTVTQTGQSIKAVNAAWNGRIPVNGSQTLGFVVNYSGANAKPTSFTVNGAVRTGEAIGRGRNHAGWLRYTIW